MPAVMTARGDCRHRGGRRSRGLLLLLLLPGVHHRDDRGGREAEPLVHLTRAVQEVSFGEQVMPGDATSPVTGIGWSSSSLSPLCTPICRWSTAVASGPTSLSK